MIVVRFVNLILNLYFRFTILHQFQTVEYNGGEGSRLHTKWTQKGRLFLHNLLTRHGYVPTVEME